MAYFKNAALLFYAMSSTCLVLGKMLPQWGDECPIECQCSINNLSQTLLSRWKQENEKVKTALCVFQENNLQRMHMIPPETEAFTFLQNFENSNFTLNADLMSNMVNVKLMDIQGSPHNAHLYVTDDVFRDANSVKFLSLQRMHLDGVDKVFSRLKALEVLQITQCKLSFLKWETFHGLASLKELYLIQDGIKEMSDFAFYGTPQLKKLYLSHNEIFSVQADSLVGLLKLEHLDLSNNRIDHLSKLTFPPLPQLNRLELKHNPIKVIFPHCFQFLNGTQHLTLGHKLQSVHIMKFSFRGLFSLIFLHIPNIDNDMLSEHMFYDLRSLLHLHLHGRIKLIEPRAFYGAHIKLEKLILHDCKLEKVMSDGFHGLDKLNTLDLSTNQLTYLPEDVFQPLESLAELILSDNQFKSLPVDIFESLGQLKSLRLDANPWNCTCDMTKWNENVTTKTPHIISVACNETETSPNCQRHVTSYMNDDRLAPKCEYPLEFQQENVFEVLKVYLTCEEVRTDKKS